MEGREDSMVWLVGGSEKGKRKEMLGWVGLYARSEGRTLKRGGTRSVHIYILPGYDSFVSFQTWQPNQRGQPCTANERQAANAGSHAMA